MDTEGVVVESEVSQESKNLGLLLWLGTLFFGFIPGLIFYVLKKEDGYLQLQSKEALNWSITLFLAYVVAGVLTVVAVGALLFPLIGLCHFFFCILGAVATYNGRLYRAPVALRLIK